MPPSRKLTDHQVRLIRNRRRNYKQSDLAREFGASSRTISEIRLGRTYQDVLPAPPDGAYETHDVIRFLESLPTGHIKGVATSPPYNKAFNKRGGKNSNWSSSKLMASNYELHDDCMSPEDYVRWQRDFLESALGAVGDDGVILYNTGRQIKNLGEDRRQAIIEGFPVRQTIIWNRGSTNNQGGKRPSIFPPIYELIYIIAGKNWRLPLKRLGEMRKWGDVWSIPFENHNPHPAPFPLALAERMVKTVDGRVCDPFAGSGTIGIAAHRLRMPYVLNDHCPTYKSYFEDRLTTEERGEKWRPY